MKTSQPCQAEIRAIWTHAGHDAAWKTCSPNETYAGHIAHSEPWSDVREIDAMWSEDSARGNVAAMVAMIETRADI